jgi:hypothetical protein
VLRLADGALEQLAHRARIAKALAAAPARNACRRHTRHVVADAPALLGAHRAPDLAQLRLGEVVKLHGLKARWKTDIERVQLALTCRPCSRRE